MITKFNESLFKVLENIIAVLLYALTAVAFFQLVMRYFLKFSYAGLDEVTRLAFVWVVSIGSSLAFRKKAHMGITYLANKLSDRNRIYLELLVYVFLIGFMVVVIKAGTQMTQMGIRQSSEYLEWSMALFYACIPSGAVLSILVFVEDIYNCLGKLREVTE
ncbi:MAG: TRAP transporter small permease [Clostridia bacterium]|jgi:TRAP-type C4-dicarboxylate transport system permease small subunit